MKFEEALFNFQQALQAEYGIEDAVVKIGLLPEAFGPIIRNIYSKSRVRGEISLEAIGQMNILNMELVAKRRENF